METEIQVKQINRKEAQNGSEYLVIETDKGKFGCWNPQLFDQLDVYQKYKVLIEQNDKYKNIIGVIEKLGKTETKFEPDNSKMASVCVSYAKDLAVAGKINLEQIGEFATKFAPIIKEVQKI